MFKYLLTIMCVGLVSTGSADEKQFDTRVLEKDGIRVKIGGEDGHTVTVDGAAFSQASRLFVVNPTWDKRYYGFHGDKEWVKRAEPSGSVPGASGLTMPLGSTQDGSVEGTQTIEILPGRKLRVATDVRMTTSLPGVIEHRIASIAEPWISGAKWRGRLRDGSTTSGVAWSWAPGKLPAETTLLQDFTELIFDSPGGPLKINVDGDARITLLDYRRNQWAEGQKYYWLGILGSPMPGQDVLSYEAVFSFSPSNEPAENESTVAANMVSGEVVKSSPKPEDRIVPTPKKANWMEGAVRLRAETGVRVQVEKVTGAGTGEIPVTQDALIESASQVIDHYSKRLTAKYGLQLERSAAPDNPIIVRLGASVPGDKAWMKDEAYILKVSDNSVQVDVQTTVGLLNALRTFEQLIRLDEEGGLGIRRVEIEDYPSLPFRGIHFFTGKNARELQLKMVNEILAPLKINNLIYQVDYVKWESQPQIHSEMLGMEKADAMAVGAAAESNGIDVIPLVNTFGHSEWLLQRPEMRYLADDPNDPYAYDPGNPRVYEICEEIYREAIAMFSPTIMHIGHDEVSIAGFPKKPENKAIGATQLFFNDTMHYRNFLKDLGIRTMIWGDMLLAPGEAPDATFAETTEEAARRRQLLPKDIMIADWHYKSAPVADYKSLGIFTKLGFDTIACTWNAPDNIVRFTRAAAEQREETTHSLGLIQTTWAGYSFDQNSLVNSLEQYMAYVLAAEAAWTGGYKDSKDVPFDFQSEFLRRWNGDIAGGGNKKGWIARLTPSTTALDPSELNLADTAFDNLQPGIQQLGGYRFHLPAIDGKLAAVRLAGAWDNPAADSSSANPTSVTLLLSPHNSATATAGELSLALATPFAVPDGAVVGQIVLNLDNQKEHVVDLRYGKNILSITDDRQTLLAPIVWKSENADPGEGGGVIHVVTVENPVPGSGIKSVRLHSNPDGPGIILFGLSGTEQK